MKGRNISVFTYALIVQILFYAPSIYASDAAAKKEDNTKSSLSEETSKKLRELSQALNTAIAKDRRKKAFNNIPKLIEDGDSKYIEIKRSHSSCPNFVSKAREVMAMRQSNFTEATMKETYQLAYQTNKQAVNLLLAWVQEAYKEPQHDLLDLKVKSIMKFMDKKKLWCDEIYGIKVQRIEAK